MTNFQWYRIMFKLCLIVILIGATSRPSTTTTKTPTRPSTSKLATIWVSGRLAIGIHVLCHICDSNVVLPGCGLYYEFMCIKLSIVGSRIFDWGTITVIERTGSGFKRIVLRPTVPMRRCNLSASLPRLLEHCEIQR